ncbi:MAG: hypothetical protein ACOC10_11210 [Bacteroidota bacterium]
MQSWKYTWFSIFIPVIVGAVFYRKLNISHRYLYFFILIGFFTELITKYLRYFTEVKNNMPVGHMYISLSFIFIAIFYLHELKGYLNQKVIAFIIILFGLFSILNILFLQSYYDYPSVAGATSALILVLFSILLFSKIMNEGKIKHLSQSSLIWINTAVLIYYSGNFFFYILFNLILNHSIEFINKTLNFFKILYVIFYFLLAMGLWKAGTRKQEQ